MPTDQAVKPTPSERLAAPARSTGPLRPEVAADNAAPTAERSTPAPADRRAPAVAPARVAIAITITLAVAAASLLLGGLTSFAQTFLPPALAPFANSNGGWGILVVIVVTIAHRGPWMSALLGLIAFHCLLQGYAIASTLRGFPDSYGPGDILFLLAFVVGPVVGVASSWQYSPRHPLRAIGSGAIGALLIGDGVASLVRVAATTGWSYWVIQITIGAAYVAYTIARRLTGWRTRLLCGAIAVIGAACCFGALAIVIR